MLLEFEFTFVRIDVNETNDKPVEVLGNCGGFSLIEPDVAINVERIDAMVRTLDSVASKGTDKELLGSGDDAI